MRVKSLASRPKETSLMHAGEPATRRVKPLGSDIPATNPTRGFSILVARLSGRKHTGIFLLCHYFATTETMP